MKECKDIIVRLRNEVIDSIDKYEGDIDFINDMGKTLADLITENAQSLQKFAIIKKEKGKIAMELDKTLDRIDFHMDNKSEIESEEVIKDLKDELHYRIKQIQKQIDVVVEVKRMFDGEEDKNILDKMEIMKTEMLKGKILYIKLLSILDEE